MLRKSISIFSLIAIIVAAFPFSPQPASAATTIDVLDYTKIASELNGKAALADGDAFGSSVAAIGDLDGDGISEIAVGTIMDKEGGTFGASSGAVYILFMNADGTVDDEVKIASGIGGKAAVSPNANGIRFGESVAALGDLDGDTIPDIAVGASNDSGSGGALDRTGSIYILYMNADGTVKDEVKIGDEIGGKAAMTAGDFFGQAIAVIGDVNDDGIQDLAVSAPQDDTGDTNRGAVYILFMDTDETVKGEQKIASDTGGKATIWDNNSGFGNTITSIGDLNEDGVPDIAIGAGSVSEGCTRCGAVFVLFLNDDGTVDSEQIISRASHAALNVVSDFQNLGSSLLWVDIDNDSTNELLVGVLQHNGGVIFTLILNADGTVADARLLVDKTKIPYSVEFSDFFGGTISTVGDLDENGYLDIVAGVSADDTGGSDRGAAYVIFLSEYVPPEPSTSPSTPIYPSSLSFDVEGGDTCPLSDTVNLVLSGKNVTDIAVADNPYFIGAAWERFLPSSETLSMIVPFKLPVIPGPHTFYALFRNGNNKSNVHTAVVNLVDDTLCPDPEEPEVPQDALPAIGDLLRTQDNPSVYLVVEEDNELVRRPFLNEAIYFTYFHDFDAVQFVDTEYLAPLRLGLPVFPNNDTTLIQFERNPSRIYIMENNLLREITTPGLTEELFTKNYHNYILTLPEFMRLHIPVGAPIARFNDYRPDWSKLQIVR